MEAAGTQPRDGDGVHRILVVANETVRGRALLEEVKRAAEGKRAEVFVVAPAIVQSRFKQGMGDVDEAMEQARARLEESLQRLRRDGLEASGRIGDSDPVLATEDALRLFPADEVIVSTHPPERSGWLEKGIVERLRNEIDLPLSHVIVDLEAEGGGTGTGEVEHIPARHHEQHGQDEPGYLPAGMPLRDRLTLVVGAVGTLTLIVLAAICPEGGEISGGCAARFLIAIGAFMITVWHTVALLVMGSLRYRGPWESFAADTVLFGIPAAIVVSLIVG